MPKLAIYVPKKEMREIEKWRKKINFSKIFMTALLKEIRERSRTAKGTKDELAAAAAFYKRKLSENSQSLVDFGFEVGSKHVIGCRLSPDVIRRVLEIEEFDTADSEAIKVIEGAIGSELRLANEHIQKHGYTERSHPTWRHEIFRGYVKGVAAAWKRVCDEMESV